MVLFNDNRTKVFISTGITQCSALFASNYILEAHSGNNTQKCESVQLHAKNQEIHASCFLKEILTSLVKIKHTKGALDYFTDITDNVVENLVEERVKGRHSKIPLQS